MPYRDFTFSDLKTECHIDDDAELRRLLFRNGFTRINQKRPIDRQTANRIVRRITGQSIDWHQYRIRDKDLGKGTIHILDEPPTEIDRFIEQVYRSIRTDPGPAPDAGSYLLGCALQGGFFTSPDDHPLIVRFDRGLNIFIGDRGTGKSTLLNTAGILSESLNEATHTLFNKLIDILSNHPDDDDSVNLRRMFTIIDRYGITRLVNFIVHRREILCCFFDSSTREAGFFVRHGNGWEPLRKISRDQLPEFRFLGQGEINRISDENNVVYLNRIIDALDPELASERLAFQKKLKALIQQFEHYQHQDDLFDLQNFSRFIHQRVTELWRMRNEMQRGRLSDQSIELIRTYIREALSFRQTTDRPDDLPIRALLDQDESAGYFLYVIRIWGFLDKALDAIEALQAALDAYATSNATELKDVLRQYETEESRTGRDESLTPIMRLYGVLGRHIADLLGFLRTRLRILDTYRRGFNSLGYSHSPMVDSLISHFKDLLDARTLLRDRQNVKCEKISKEISNGGSRISITTPTDPICRTSIETQLDCLSGLKDDYHLFYNASIRTPVYEFRDAASRYNRLMDLLMTELDELSRDNNYRNRFVFCPIRIEFSQGRTTRSFHELSFGQKTGIVLKMVFTTITDQILIIDQPEDNLDINSIVSMLTPTLQSLGKDTQIIIATHASNLVLGLEDYHLIVMESDGEHGRIRMQGTPDQEAIREEMLNILEGGIENFQQKLDIYRNFLHRLNEREFSTIHPG